MESDRVLEALKRLVEENPPEVFEKSKTFRALLNDSLGADGRKNLLQVNLLVTAVDAGVPEELMGQGTDGQEITQRLVSQRGLSPEHAAWAVATLTRVLPSRKDAAPEIPIPPAQIIEEPSPTPETGPTPRHSRPKSAPKWSGAVALLFILVAGALGVALGGQREQSPPPPGPAVRRGIALGTGVVVRAAPSVSSEKVGSVAKGGRVEILCTTPGDIINGVSGPTNLWNKVREPAGFVSDGFLDTTGQMVSVPECASGQPGNQYSWSGYKIEQLEQMAPVILQPLIRTTQLRDAMSTQKVLSRVSVVEFAPGPGPATQPSERLKEWFRRERLSEVIPESNLQYSQFSPDLPNAAVAAKAATPSTPRSFRGVPLERIIEHLDYSVLVYSTPDKAGYLVGVDKKSGMVRYAFDLSRWPVATVSWAIERDGILYAGAQGTVAPDSGGGIVALDLRANGKQLWRSDPNMTSLSQSFALAGEMIFTTYSCECDGDLSPGPFALDAKTGEVLQDYSEFGGGGGWLIVKGDRLLVSGYSAEYVYKILSTQREPDRRPRVDTIDLSKMAPQVLSFSQVETVGDDGINRREDLFNLVETTRNPAVPEGDLSNFPGIPEEVASRAWRKRYGLTGPAGTLRHVPMAKVNLAIPRSYGGFRLQDVWTQEDRWFLYYGENLDGVKEYRFVFAFDPKKNKTLYGYRLEGQEKLNTLEESNGVLFAQSYRTENSDRFLNALDLASGKVLWRLKEGGDVFDWYLKDSLVIRACCGPYGSENNRLSAFDLRTGQHLQSVALQHDPAEVVFKGKQMFVRGYRFESIIRLNTTN